MSLRSWLDELRGIKAEKDKPRTPEEAGRREKTRREQAESDARVAQANALREEWDSVVKQHLVKLCEEHEAMRYQDNSVRVFPSDRPCITSVPTYLGAITLSSKHEFFGGIEWKTQGSNYFSVYLVYHFDKQGLLVADRFIAIGSTREEALVTIPGLRNALREVFRVGPARSPGWESDGIGAISW